MDGSELDERVEQPVVALDKKAASRATLWSVLFASISKLVFPLAGIYVVRILGPEIMGSFALMMTIVNFSEVVRDAGLSQTYLATPEMNEEKERSYFGVAIVSAIVPAILLVLLAEPFAQFFSVPELVWALPIVSLVVAMNGFSTIPRAKMLKSGQIKQYGLIDLMGAGLGLCASIVLVQLGFGFTSLVVQVVLAAAFNLGVSWIRFPIRGVRFGIDAFRQVGRKAIAVLAANGINNLFLLADHVVINKFAGVTANGYFGQAASLAYKPAELFVFPMSRTLMVAFSQSSVDQERLSRVYARSLTFAIIAALPVFGLLGFFADPIIRILLTDRFAGSIPVLSAMSIYLSFRVLGNLSGYALVPAGKHFQTFYPWLGAALLTTLLVAFTVWGRGQFPDPELLMPLVWCFVGGAALVYSSLVALGLRYCRPAQAEWSKLWRGAASLISSLATMACISALPISAPAQLGIALIAGPILHLAFIGTFFAGNPLYYLNSSGPKRLWADL